MFEQLLVVVLLMGNMLEVGLEVRMRDVVERKLLMDLMGCQ